MPSGTEEASRIIRVGDAVEREIDDIWFPAKVLAVHEAHRGRPGSQYVRLPAYDLLYLDDHNRESEVPEDELRPLGDERSKYASLQLDGDGQGTGARGGTGSSVAEANVDTKGGEFGSEGGEGDHRGGDEGPKVTIHSSHGAFDTKEDGSANAYIINGPETNVAAGSGLRGIRWLRGPDVQDR